MSETIYIHKPVKVDAPAGAAVTVIEPKRNAVIIDLYERRQPDGSVRTEKVISIECKDPHLERQLVDMARRLFL